MTLLLIKDVPAKKRHHCFKKKVRAKKRRHCLIKTSLLIKDVTAKKKGVTSD